MTAHNFIFEDVEGVALKARPFKIMAKPNNDTLVILVHGFSGTPYDLWFLAESLADDGLDVQVPLLSGHGGSLERLAKTDYPDWVKSAEKVLLENKDKYEKIFLIGYSFGANISLHLALKYSQLIRGVIALGILIYKRQEWITRLLLPLTRFLPKFNYEKSWLTEEEKNSYLDAGRQIKLPLTSLSKVAYFLDHFTKKEIKELTLPVLAIHSRDDEVSHPRGSEYLFKNLSSQDKSLYILNKQDHNPTTNKRRDFVFTKILNFIRGH